MNIFMCVFSIPFQIIYCIEFCGGNYIFGLASSDTQNYVILLVVGRYRRYIYIYI